MAHFSLFVFLAVLYYALPVAAQANSTQSSNVDVVGLYVDGSKVITQRCPAATETFADYSTSGHKFGFCAPKTQGLATPDPDEYAFVGCDSQARAKGQNGNLAECGPKLRCDTITMYPNYVKGTSTLWVSCFDTADITARTLFKYITPSATVTSDTASTPDSLTWTNVVSATIPIAPPTNVASLSYATGAPLSTPSSSNILIGQRGKILIGVLVPTFLLIISGLIFYIITLHKTRRNAREAEEARQYLEALDNHRFNDNLHELPAEPEISNASKSSNVLSSPGCSRSSDSATEEPTNLSSYSMFFRSEI